MRQMIIRRKLENNKDSGEEFQRRKLPNPGKGSGKGREESLKGGSCMMGRLTREMRMRSFSVESTPVSPKDTYGKGDLSKLAFVIDTL